MIKKNICWVVSALMIVFTTIPQLSAMPRPKKNLTAAEQPQQGPAPLAPATPPTSPENPQTSDSPPTPPTTRQPTRQPKQREPQHPHFIQSEKDTSAENANTSTEEYRPTFPRRPYNSSKSATRNPLSNQPATAPAPVQQSTRRQTAAPAPIAQEPVPVAAPAPQTNVAPSPQQPAPSLWTRFISLFSTPAPTPEPTVPTRSALPQRQPAATQTADASASNPFGVPAPTPQPAATMRPALPQRPPAQPTAARQKAMGFVDLTPSDRAEITRYNNASSEDGFIQLMNLRLRFLRENKDTESIEEALRRLAGYNKQRTVAYRIDLQSRFVSFENMLKTAKADALEAFIIQGIIRLNDDYKNTTSGGYDYGTNGSTSNPFGVVENERKPQDAQQIEQLVRAAKDKKQRLLAAAPPAESPSARASAGDASEDDDSSDEDGAAAVAQAVVRERARKAAVAAAQAQLVAEPTLKENESSYLFYETSSYPDGTTERKPGCRINVKKITPNNGEITAILGNGPHGLAKGCKVTYSHSEDKTRFFGSGLNSILEVCRESGDIFNLGDVRTSRPPARPSAAARTGAGDEDATALTTTMKRQTTRRAAPSSRTAATKALAEHVGFDD